MDKSESMEIQFNIDGQLLNVDVPMDLVPRIFEVLFMFNKLPFKMEFINTILQSRTVEDPLAPEEVFKWQDNAVKLLLENCELEKENFRNPKIKKNNIWVKISKKMNEFQHNVTPDMCDKKFRNLKMTYRAVNDKMKKTGRARQHWEYFKLMDGILSSDATVNPPFLISSLKPCTMVHRASTNRSVEQEPQPSTSGYNPINVVSKLVEAETPPQNVQPHAKLGKKKNRDLQEYRKEIITIEKEKLKKLEELNETYRTIAECMKDRNNLLREYLNKKE